MVVLVERRNVIVVVVEDDEHAVVAHELAKEVALLVVVDALDIHVEPHRTAAQCASTMSRHSDALYLGFGEQVTLDTTSLDRHFGEVLLEAHGLCLAVAASDGDADGFCLAIDIGCHIDNLRAFLALGYVVLLVAHHRSDIETLDHKRTALAIAIYDIVDGADIVLAIDIEVEHIVADEDLFCHLDYLVLAALEYHEDIVDLRAVAHIFALALLETSANEALVAVDHQSQGRFDHLGRVDGVEVAYLGETRMILAIFLFQMLKPLDGVIGDVLDVLLALLDLLLGIGNVLFSLRA